MNKKLLVEQDAIDTILQPFRDINLLPPKKYPPRPAPTPAPRPVPPPNKDYQVIQKEAPTPMTKEQLLQMYNNRIISNLQGTSMTMDPKRGSPVPLQKELTEHYYNILLEKQEDSSMFDFLNPLKWIEKIGQAFSSGSSNQGRVRNPSGFDSSEEPRYEMNFDVAQSMANAGENSDDYYKWMAGLQGKNNRYRTSSMIRTRALASALSRRKVAEAGRLARENPDVIKAQEEYDRLKAEQAKNPSKFDPNDSNNPLRIAAKAVKDATSKAKRGVEGYDAAVRGVNAFSSGPMNLQPVERRGTGFSVGKGSMGQPIITGGSYKDPNSPRARLEADGILNPDGSINASRYEKDEVGYLNTEAGRAAALRDIGANTQKEYEKMKSEFIAKNGPMPTEEEVTASRARMAQEERNNELERLKSNLRSRGRRTSPPRKPKRFTRQELLQKGMNPDLADMVD